MQFQRKNAPYKEVSESILFIQNSTFTISII